MLVAEELQAVGHRVLLGGARDLVDQRLHHERRVRGAHAAPPQHRHVQLGLVHGQAHRQVVGLPHAFHGGGIDTVLDHRAFEEGAGQDRLADDDVVPGQHPAVGVDTDAGTVQVHRSVVAALDVVLARPQRAHRRVQAGGARGLGDGAGFDDVVAGRDRAAPEAAAGHLHVHLHLLGLEAEHLGSSHAVDAGELAAHPQFGPVVADAHRAVQRLHRGVGQVGEDELGLDAPGGGRERRHVGIEVSRARTVGEAAIVRQLPGAVDLLDAGRVPPDLQRIAPLLRRPVAVGHDRHAFGAAVKRHAQHRAHALDRAGCRIVHRGQLRAEDRRARDDRRQLAGQPHVDAVGLLPAALGDRIEPARGAADEAEVLRRLEGHRLRHRQGHRGVGQFAVAQPAPVGRDHEAGLGAQGRGVDVPARRGGRQEHRARTGTQLTVLGEAVLDGVGPAGEVHSEHRVGIGAGIGAVARSDAAPVGIQLLGQDQRQRGLHALAEVEAVDRDRDRAVRRDLDEGGRLLSGTQWLRCCSSLGTGLRHRGDGKGAQGQAGGAGQLQELATRQCGFG